MDKNKIKEFLKNEEIRQYITEIMEEQLEKELKDEEYKKQPTPHYLSEYGNYLVKTPITLSDIKYPIKGIESSKNTVIIIV